MELTDEVRSNSIIYVVAAKAVIHDSVPPAQFGEFQRIFSTLFSNYPGGPYRTL